MCTHWYRLCIVLPLHAVALSQIVGWVKERMLGGIPPVKGAYLIIDGGYHKWAATQAAAKVTTSLNYTA